MIDISFNTIEVLLLEDNNKDAKYTIALLSQLGVKYITRVISCRKAIEVFDKNNFDLLLIDVFLGEDRRRGDDFVRYVRRKKIYTPTIYLTNLYESKVYEKVKDTYPTCFLRKDLSLLSLRQAVELALVPKLRTMPLKAVPSFTSETFFIKIGEHYKSIYLQDICFFKSENKSVYICIAKRFYPTTLTIKNLENQLFRFDFIRVHRAYIVNMNKINSIDKQNDKLIIEDISIPIGAVYRKQVWNRINLIR